MGSHAGPCWAHTNPMGSDTRRAWHPPLACMGLTWWRASLLACMACMQAPAPGAAAAAAATPAAHCSSAVPSSLCARGCCLPCCPARGETVNPWQLVRTHAPHADAGPCAVSSRDFVGLCRNVLHTAAGRQAGRHPALHPHVLSSHNLSARVHACRPLPPPLRPARRNLQHRVCIRVATRRQPPGGSLCARRCCCLPRCPAQGKTVHS